MDTLATSTSYRYSYGLDDYSYASNAVGASAGMGVWSTISIVAALVGGIIVYFLFVKSKKCQPKNKFFAWLKKFCSFDIMWIEDMLKVLYIVCTIFVTLSSFSFFAMGPLGILIFLIAEVLGNFLIRIAYESALVKIMLWRNTTDIKNAVVKSNKK